MSAQSAVAGTDPHHQTSSSLTGQTDPRPVRERTADSHESTSSVTSSTAVKTVTHAHEAETAKNEPNIQPSPVALEPPHFVTPADFLRPTKSVPARPTYLKHESSMGASSVLDREQFEGLRAIRKFLALRTPYDVLPLSYRTIMLDTSLLVKKSFNIMNQTGIASAPLWDSKTSTFAGMLATTDYLNVVQYYWQHPEALDQIDSFRLHSLRDIERAIGVTPIETVSIHPLQPLDEACRRMLKSRARRIPLIDIDDETQREMVVSVMTQYRILKFVSVNVTQTQMLRKPLRDLPTLGTYEDLATAKMDTPVMDVIHALVKRAISCVPVVADDGTVLNLFEAVDVFALIKGSDYENLNLSVGKALEKRSDEFPGIYTCTLNDHLDTIIDTVRKSRVHRFIVVDEQNKLKGLLSLSDILDYALNSPLDDEDDDTLIRLS